MTLNQANFKIMTSKAQATKEKKKDKLNFIKIKINNVLARM